MNNNQGERSRIKKPIKRNKNFEGGKVFSLVFLFCFESRVAFRNALKHIKCEEDENMKRTRSELLISARRPHDEHSTITRTQQASFVFLGKKLHFLCISEASISWIIDPRVAVGGAQQSELLNVDCPWLRNDFDGYWCNHCTSHAHSITENLVQLWTIHAWEASSASMVLFGIVAAFWGEVWLLNLSLVWGVTACFGWLWMSRECLSW